MCALQCVPNDDGYGPVVVDGIYGPQTRAAGGVLPVNATFGARTRRVVGHYQHVQGVPVTGVVDERTRFFLAMGAVMHRQS